VGDENITTGHTLLCTELNDMELNVGNDLTLVAFSCLRVSGDITMGGLHTWSVRGWNLKLVNIIDSFSSLLSNE
jgi:hypothetical protein